MSENTLFGCVDGFDKERISIFNNKEYGIQMSAVIKRIIESIRQMVGDFM